MRIIMEGGLKGGAIQFLYLLRINGYLLSKFCRVSAFIDRSITHLFYRWIDLGVYGIVP